MAKQISKFLNKAGIYTEKEILLLEKEIQFRVLAKDEIILDKGSICSSLIFIDSGSVYHYYVDSEHIKNVIDLNIANDWVLNHKSFTSREPSEYYIKAFENTSIYELSIDAIHRLIAQSQSFLQMGKILEESTSRIKIFDNNYTPDEKYQYILDNKPELLQIFPQKLIASFLKITPARRQDLRSRYCRCRFRSRP